ncbi:hypothetical protein, partial [Acetivibrio saccincola]|uniref:hypothetical protein n=1 Tax=Acetivibrio saccincola TaxID=1677857 RepID=UPI002352EF40
ISKKNKENHRYFKYNEYIYKGRSGKVRNKYCLNDWICGINKIEGQRKSKSNQNQKNKNKKMEVFNNVQSNTI